MDTSKNFEIEYKRRFLATVLPSNIILSILPKVDIQLGYLNRGQDTLELECECVMDSKYVLNIRDIGTIKRNKIKIPLDEVSASVIMTLSNPKLLNIEQYTIVDGGKKLLINVYTKLQEQLIIVEFIGTESEVRNFKPLPWFKKEITDLYQYSNISIAINKKINL